MIKKILTGALLYISNVVVFGLLGFLVFQIVAVRLGLLGEIGLGVIIILPLFALVGGLGVGSLVTFCLTSNLVTKSFRYNLLSFFVGSIFFLFFLVLNYASMLLINPIHVGLQPTFLIYLLMMLAEFLSYWVFAACGSLLGYLVGRIIFWRREAIGQPVTFEIHPSGLAKWAAIIYLSLGILFFAAFTLLTLGGFLQKNIESNLKPANFGQGPFIYVFNGASGLSGPTASVYGLDGKHFRTMQLIKYGAQIQAILTPDKKNIVIVGSSAAAGASAYNYETKVVFIDSRSQGTVSDVKSFNDFSDFPTPPMITKEKLFLAAHEKIVTMDLFSKEIISKIQLDSAGKEFVHRAVSSDGRYFFSNYTRNGVNMFGKIDLQSGKIVTETSDLAVDLFGYVGIGRKSNQDILFSTKLMPDDSVYFVLIDPITLKEVQRVFVMKGQLDSLSRFQVPQYDPVENIVYLREVGGPVYAVNLESLTVAKKFTPLGYPSNYWIGNIYYYSTSWATRDLSENLILYDRISGSEVRRIKLSSGQNVEEVLEVGN